MFNTVQKINRKGPQTNMENTAMLIVLREN